MYIVYDFNCINKIPQHPRRHHNNGDYFHRITYGNSGFRFLRDFHRSGEDNKAGNRSVTLSSSPDNIAVFFLFSLRVPPPPERDRSVDVGGRKRIRLIEKRYDAQQNRPVQHTQRLQYDTSEFPPHSGYFLPIN